MSSLPLLVSIGSDVNGVVPLPPSSSTARPSTPVPLPPTNGARRPMHRLGEVRRNQGVSRRTIARHLHLELSAVRQQEDEHADLPLSVLYEWQKVLDVPLSELLVEPDDTISPVLAKRAKMVRLMKTVLLIQERARQLPIRRMAEMLVEQLEEIMPELKGVKAWNAVGHRRSLQEQGRAAEYRFSPQVFFDPG